MMLTSGMCLSFFGLSVALLYVETRNWSIYSISHNFRRSVFSVFFHALYSLVLHNSTTIKVRYQPCEDVHLNIHEDIDLYHQTLIQNIWGLFIGTSAPPDIHLSPLAIRSD